MEQRSGPFRWEKKAKHGGYALGPGCLVMGTPGHPFIVEIAFRPPAAGLQPPLQQFCIG
jgi:hypothetical protein